MSSGVTEALSDRVRDANRELSDQFRSVLPPEQVDRFMDTVGEHGWTLLGVGALLFAVLPLAVLETGFYMTVIMDMFLFGVLALSWDLIGGQTGYPSFGNMAFFGIGAYTTAILTKTFGVPFPIAFLVAGVLAVAFAGVIGVIVLRLRGHYFAIATLGVLLATQQVSRNLDITGGASGIILLDTPGQTTFYYLYLGLLVVEMALVYYLSGTRFGYVLNAIRDDEAKATAMGFNTTYYKTAAWMMAGLFTGLVGAAWSLDNGFLEPQSAFNGAWNVEMIAMALIGGTGTVAGPVLGAFGLHGLIVFVGSLAAGWQLVLLGLAVILTVTVFPNGAVGTLAEYAGEMEYFRHGGMAAAEPDAPPDAPPGAAANEPEPTTNGDQEVDSDE